MNEVFALMDKHKIPYTARYYNTSARKVAYWKDELKRIQRRAQLRENKGRAQQLAQELGIELPQRPEHRWKEVVQELEQKKKNRDFNQEDIPIQLEAADPPKVSLAELTQEVSTRKFIV